MNRSIALIVLLAAGGGLALSFAPSRVAGADAPTGRYTVSSGTVYDTKTKLTWQQTLSASSYTWDNAKAYCAGLSLNGSGWRLPSLGELESIVDDSRAPATDPAAFPSTPAAAFWSSSPLASNSALAWYVFFDFGNAGGDAVTVAYRVRCVR